MRYPFARSDPGPVPGSAAMNRTLDPVPAKARYGPPQDRSGGYPQP